MGNETKKEDTLIGANENPEQERARKNGFFLGYISAINLAIAQLAQARKEMEALYSQYEKNGNLGEGTDKVGRA